MGKSLDEWKAEFDELVANISDEELEEFFPVGPTDKELLTELGYLSGHKYLNPSKFERRELIIASLIETGVLYPSYENPFPGRVATFFHFVGADKEENERIYTDAYGKQLLRKPE